MTEVFKKNSAKLAFPKRLRPIILLCLFLAYSVNLFGLNHLVEFENVELFRGQGSLTVFSISQDSTGFIWIASNKGLFRYDGINYKRYIYRSETPGCIFSNIIFRTCVDPQGVLWFSGNRAFGFYNPITDSFKSFNMDSLLDNGSRSIYDMTADSNSVLLGLMEGEIFRFDKTTHSLTKIFSVSSFAEKNKVSFTEINNYIYCSINSKINKINKADYSVVKANLNIKGIAGKKIYPLFFNKSKKLLVGMDNMKIMVFQDDKLNNLYTIRSSSANSNQYGIILDIVEESNGNLWLATF